MTSLPCALRSLRRAPADTFQRNSLHLCGAHVVRHHFPYEINAYTHEFSAVLNHAAVLRPEHYYFIKARFRSYTSSTSGEDPKAKL